MHLARLVNKNNEIRLKNLTKYTCPTIIDAFTSKQLLYTQALAL